MRKFRAEHYWGLAPGPENPAFRENENPFAAGCLSPFSDRQTLAKRANLDETMQALLLLCLLCLVMLAVFGIVLFGAVLGLLGIVLGIQARGQPDPPASTSRQEAARFGKHALIAAALYSAAFAAVFAINPRISLHLLLFAEPALMFGAAAIVLARSSSPRGVRVLDLMLLVAWIALALAIPIEISALQTDREAWWTIDNSYMRVDFADDTMEENYEWAVRSKGSWSIRKQQTYDWAQIGLSDSRTGLRAVEYLATRTTAAPERRELSRLHDEFSRQIKRYEQFVRGLGGKP
jgi:hypothetical protein